MDWSLRRLVGSWVCVAGDEREDASMCVIVYIPATLQWLEPLPLLSNTCQSLFKCCLCDPGICASLVHSWNSNDV